MNMVESDAITVTDERNGQRREEYDVEKEGGNQEGTESSATGTVRPT